MSQATLRYRMVIEWSDEDQAYLVTLPEWESRVFQPVTHGATYTQAAKNGAEVLAMLVQGEEEDGGELPEPRTFLPFDDGGNRRRHVIIRGEDDEDALPYQERIVRLATGRDDAEDSEDHVR
jgi:predicted RNase H-like HicB family nuclease